MLDRKGMSEAGSKEMGSLIGLFGLAPVLGSSDRYAAKTAGDEIDRQLHAMSGRDIVHLSAAARASFRQTLGTGSRDRRTQFAQAIEQVAPNARGAVAGLLSLHRDGYLREPATEEVAKNPDPLGTAFLLLRVDDIVPSTRETAIAGLEGRLGPRFVRSFARALPIVEMLRERKRGGGSTIVRRIHELLRSNDAECRAALLEATADSDSITRRAAYRIRLEVGPAHPVLLEALGDRDGRVRWWAARTAASRATSDAEKLELVSHLEASGSPSIRRLALRMRAKLDISDTPLEKATLDHNAAVRLTARELLRKRHPDRETGTTRAAAISVLHSIDATTRELVGALGALADLGARQDGVEVETFLEHPRRQVRDEAARTVSILSGNQGGRARLGR